MNKYSFSHDFLNNLKNRRFQPVKVSGLDIIVIFNHLLTQFKNFKQNDVFYGVMNKKIKFIAQSLKYETLFLHENDKIKITVGGNIIFGGLSKDFKIDECSLLDSQDLYEITIVQQVNFKKNAFFSHPLISLNIPFLIYQNYEDFLVNWTGDDEFYFWGGSFDSKKFTSLISERSAKIKNSSQVSKINDLFVNFNKNGKLCQLILNSKNI